jgi:prevent-host-death family protein
MTRTSDITNFTDFRARLRDHLDERKATGRPLFVTANGQTEAVVLSATAYDELMDRAALAESLKAGRTQPAKAALKKIADELGLKLHR